MSITTKKQKVDLRKVKKHKLYPVLNEYFQYWFGKNPEDETFIVSSAEDLRQDLYDRNGSYYKKTELISALEAYGDELPTGGYIVNRKDFYLPETI